MTAFPLDLTLDELDGDNGFLIRGPNENASFGFSVAAHGDVTGDGIDDLVIGARDLGLPDNGGVTIVPGRLGGFTAELGFGVPGNSTFSSTQGEDDGRSVGRSVDIIGDMNGDGIDDFVVGAPFQRLDLSEDDPFFSDLPVGAAHVVFGGSHVSSLQSLDSPGDRGFSVLGDSFFGRLGSAVAGAGDVNGDGFADVLIGAPRSDVVGQQRDTGEAFLIYGSASVPDQMIVRGGFAGTGINLDAMQDANLVTRLVNLTDISAGLGFSLDSAGDFNGDGFDDIIVGAPHLDGAVPTGFPNFGEAYVIFGQPGGLGATVDVQALTGVDGFALTGGRSLGRTVAGIGDVNGDGFDDIAVSGSQSGGRVIFGTNQTLPASISIDELPVGTGFFIGTATDIIPLGDIDCPH